MAKTQEITLALDSRALIQSAKDPRIEAIIRKWVSMGATVLVPAVALAEVIRGKATDASVNRLIKAVGWCPAADEAIARTAGALIGGRRNLTVDALIVATATACGATDILTTDPDDVRALSGGTLNVIPLT